MFFFTSITDFNKCDTRPKLGGVLKIVAGFCCVFYQLLTKCCSHLQATVQSQLTICKTLKLDIFPNAKTVDACVAVVREILCIL